MSVIVSCPCGKRFQAKSELAGKKIRCSSCGNILTIGSGAPVAAEVLPAASREPVAARQAEPAAAAYNPAAPVAASAQVPVQAAVPSSPYSYDKLPQYQSNQGRKAGSGLFVLGIVAVALLLPLVCVVGSVAALLMRFSANDNSDRPTAVRPPTASRPAVQQTPALRPTPNRAIPNRPVVTIPTTPPPPIRTPPKIEVPDFTPPKIDIPQPRPLPQPSFKPPPTFKPPTITRPPTITIPPPTTRPPTSLRPGSVTRPGSAPVELTEANKKTIYLSWQRADEEFERRAKDFRERFNRPSQKQIQQQFVESMRRTKESRINSLLRRYKITQEQLDEIIAEGKAQGWSQD